MRAAIDRLDAGTVFRFWQDGTHEVLSDEDAPSVYGVGDDSDNGILIDSGEPWFTVTEGMTNQHGYDGPVMHDSEFISTGMVESILGQYDHRQHYFTVQYVLYSCDLGCPDCTDDIEGWVILAKNVSVNG